MDQIICFEPLSREAITGIADKYLQELTVRGKDTGVELQLPKELSAMLGNTATGKAGARQLRKQIQEQVEAPLAEYLLRCETKPALVRGLLEGGNLRFEG